MAVQNPSKHARVAADALARLVTDVRSGRAAWEHPHTIRQSTDDLIRVADSLAAAVQQITAAHVQTSATGSRTPGRADPATDALLRAGQSAAGTADRLRRARRTMH
jgi:hypothetical protein